jgi:hypothetical protein
MADEQLPHADADGDGMPDTLNAKMPALSFLAAMVALVPVLFGLKSSIAALSGDGASRTLAFALNIGAVAVATGSIIAAAYGARAATRGLASAGRWIAISEIVVALLLIIILFFKQ